MLKNEVIHSVKDLRGHNSAFNIFGYVPTYNNDHRHEVVTELKVEANKIDYFDGKTLLELTTKEPVQNGIQQIPENGHADISDNSVAESSDEDIDSIEATNHLDIEKDQYHGDIDPKNLVGLNGQDSLICPESNHFDETNGYYHEVGKHGGDTKFVSRGGEESEFNYRKNTRGFYNPLTGEAYD